MAEGERHATPCLTGNAAYRLTMVRNSLAAVVQPSWLHQSIRSPSPTCNLQPAPAQPHRGLIDLAGGGGGAAVEQLHHTQRLHGLQVAVCGRLGSQGAGSLGRAGGWAVQLNGEGAPSWGWEPPCMTGGLAGEHQGSQPEPAVR